MAARKHKTIHDPRARLLRLLERSSHVDGNTFMVSCRPYQALTLIEAGVKPIHAEDSQRFEELKKTYPLTRRMFYFEAFGELRVQILKPRIVWQDSFV